MIINREPQRYHAASGSYLEIHRNWQLGDKVSLDLPMNVRYIESHPSVEENVGRIAISRGPLVYCLEAVDNPEVLLSEIRINPSTQPAIEFVPDLLNGIMRLHLIGKVQSIDPNWRNKLYRTVRINKHQTNDREIEILSIPYYAWANRKPGAMEIWHLYK